MKTRITELFDIEYPIILGGLQWLGRAELAAAVSEAGGFGLITAHCFPTAEDLAIEIKKVRSMTSKPFGVNISLRNRSTSRTTHNSFFDVAVDAGVKAIFTSGLNPGEFYSRLKHSGITLVHVVPAVRYAIKAEQVGADAVVIVGCEAGGHPGNEETTMSLVPRTVDSVSIPVIAAGGIGDARGFVAALALGAEGVQMGTRFLPTFESAAHPKVKEAYIRATEVDTVLIERSIGTIARVLNTEVAQKVLEIETSGKVGIEDLLHLIGGQATRKVLESGDYSQGVIYVGQCIGLVDKLMGAQEVVKGITTHFEEVMVRLKKMEL